ncbi:type II toxin-antitoxin system RelE/ParE family toxin [Candidatus Uhrbacteria bacterium]|nr:type II toxin-antitoxin system RelE/ParE family toxin [Candidatus Uhrbacteria bacterium]
MDFFFAPSALKQFKKLPREVQKRIFEKMEFFCTQDDPLDFAETVKDSRLGSYRFHVGDYRVIIDLEKPGIAILAVDHRKDIYR